MQLLSDFDHFNRSFLFPLIIGFMLGLLTVGVVWMRFNFTLKLFGRTLHSPPAHSCGYCNVGD